MGSLDGFVTCVVVKIGGQQASESVLLRLVPASANLDRVLEEVFAEQISSEACDDKPSAAALRLAGRLEPKEAEKVVVNLLGKGSPSGYELGFYGVGHDFLGASRGLLEEGEVKGPAPPGADLVLRWIGVFWLEVFVWGGEAVLPYGGCEVCLAEQF
jgi:hypothetical protein